LTKEKEELQTILEDNNKLLEIKTALIEEINEKLGIIIFGDGEGKPVHLDKIKVKLYQDVLELVQAIGLVKDNKIDQNVKQQLKDKLDFLTEVNNLTAESGLPIFDEHGNFFEDNIVKIL